MFVCLGQSTGLAWTKSPHASKERSSDPEKGQDVPAQKEQLDLAKLGLDTSTIDWSTALVPGTCGACSQKFGAQDKDRGSKVSGVGF